MSFTAGVYEGNNGVYSKESKGRASPVEAIRTATKSVFKWIETKSRQARNRRFDAYLSRSTDHADLARRIGNMERNSRPNWANYADC